MNKFCCSLLIALLALIVTPLIVFQYKPQNFNELQTLEQEIVDIVKNAYRNDEHVKVIGAGHSWTPIHLTDGHMINLDEYSAILITNKPEKRVKVEAGIRLKNLVNYLETQGLALANVGHMTEQSIAGAVSTSTHGHGITKGAISTQIVEFDLILANGTILRGITAVSNPDLFYAGRVGLGLLGIFSTMTIQCVEAFNLRKIEVKATLDHILKNFKTYLNGYEWFKFWWIFETPYVKLSLYNRTELPRNHSEISRFIEYKVEIPVLSCILLFEASYPDTISFIHPLVEPLLTAPKDYIDRSDLALIGPFPNGYTEMEFFVPIEKFVDAHRAYEKVITENNCSVNFINENRFVKADENWLSPFYKRDTGVISFIMYKREEEFLRCGKKVNDMFMTQFEGRPHWAKVNFFQKWDFSKVYPKFISFGNLRRSLDPKGIFMNDYFATIFNF